MTTITYFRLNVCVWTLSAMCLLSWEHVHAAAGGAAETNKTSTSADSVPDYITPGPFNYDKLNCARRYSYVKINPFEQDHLDKNEIDANGSACANRHFSKHDLPTTALASFPGCGNTWVRHLIEQLTGIYSGGNYNDYTLRWGGFPGEGVDDFSVIVKKTHFPILKHPKYPEEYKRYERAIIVLRRPLDCLLAEFNRGHTRGSHLNTAPRDVIASEWDNHVHNKIRWWQWFYDFWMRKEDKCMMVVDFNRLKTNMSFELRRIGRFLGVEPKYMTDEHLKCIKENSRGRFKRKKSVSADDITSPELRNFVKRYAVDIKELSIAKFGYIPDFD